MSKTFSVTYAVPKGNIEVTRIMAKNEADVRQIISNQDWMDGFTILEIKDQAKAEKKAAALHAKFEQRYGLDNVWPAA